MCTSNSARRPHGVRAARGRTPSVWACRRCHRRRPGGCVLDETADALFDGHAPAGARSGHPGGRAGQARRASARSTAPCCRRAASEVPDYRPCDDALTRVGTRAGRHRQACRSRPVEAAPGRRGRWPASAIECFEEWLQPPGTAGSTCSQFGYDVVHVVSVDALSSSANNARQIRDKIMAHAPGTGRAAPGTGRLLQGRARHPRGGRRVSGNSQPRRGRGQRRRRRRRLGAGQRCQAVRGRPAAALSGLDLPDRATAAPSNSLRPAMRRAWLAQNPLPRDVRYYSLVTFPQPERISSILDVELRQAGPHRRAQRQPDDLLRPGRAREARSSAMSTPTTGRLRCRSRARIRRSDRCS